MPTLHDKVLDVLRELSKDIRGGTDKHPRLCAASDSCCMHTSSSVRLGDQLSREGRNTSAELQSLTLEIAWTEYRGCQLWSS